MMNQIQLSGDAIAGIIWFVIFVIWAVGKAIASMREQKIRREYDRKTAGQAAPEAPGMEDQLRNFLEALTGEELPRPRPAAPPPPPAPVPEPERPARVSPYGAFPKVPTVRTPQFQHKQHGTRRAAPQRRVYNPLLDDAGTVIGDENVVEKMAAGAALPGHEYMLGTRNDGMRLPMFGLQLPDPDKLNRAVYPWRIRGGNALRRAMIDRVVLGPPRGMSPRMPCEDQRQV